MSDQKSKHCIKAEAVLREKGYDPNDPGFSNLGTNELVRRAKEIKKKRDEPDSQRNQNRQAKEILNSKKCLSVLK